VGSRAIALPEIFSFASSLSSKFAAKYAIFVRKLDWVAAPLHPGAQVFAEIGSNLFNSANRFIPLSCHAPASFDLDRRI